MLLSLARPHCDMFNPVNSPTNGYAERCCLRPLHGLATGAPGPQGRLQLPHPGQWLGLGSAWHEHEGHLPSVSVFGFRDTPGISFSHCALHPNMSSCLSSPFDQDLISPYATSQTS